MSIDSIVSIASMLVTLFSTGITIYQAKKAKGYRNKTKALYNAFDKNMLAERCSQITSEISNISGSTNNNKGGKLSSLFDRVNSLMSDIQKFISRNNVDASRIILQKKNDITNYIISNRDNPTIDVVYLSIRMNELDIKIQSLCGDVLNEIE